MERNDVERLMTLADKVDAGGSTACLSRSEKREYEKLGAEWNEREAVLCCPQSLSCFM